MQRRLTDDLEGALAPCRREIVLLHQENGGETAAKKAAARETAGDFVLILDTDDVYLPERIAALTELAHARPDLDILTTDGLLVAGGRPVRRVYDRSWRFDVGDQRGAILQRNFILGWPSRAISRRGKVGPHPPRHWRNRGRGVAAGVPTESSPLRTYHQHQQARRRSLWWLA